MSGIARGASIAQEPSIVEQTMGANSGGITSGSGIVDNFIPPTTTGHLTDDSGNVLTDDSGNRLTPG